MASQSMWLFLLLSCAACTEVLGEIIMRPSCATGWFYHNSHCYGYFRKSRNWFDAELECQSHGNGAHLASVLNAKEANTIAGYISGYQKIKSVWIGLHDPQKKQQWKWIDGAMYLYRTWSGKSVGEKKYCAEMNYHNNTGMSKRDMPVCFWQTDVSLILKWIDSKGNTKVNYSDGFWKESGISWLYMHDFLSWTSNNCSKRQHFLCKYRP